MDFFREEVNQRKPENLYPGVIADAQRCRNTEERERKRAEREVGATCRSVCAARGSRAANDTKEDLTERYGTQKVSIKVNQLRARTPLTAQK